MRSFLGLFAASSVLVLAAACGDDFQATEETGDAGSGGLLGSSGNTAQSGGSKSTGSGGKVNSGGSNTGDAGENGMGSGGTDASGGMTTGGTNGSGGLDPTGGTDGVGGTNLGGTDGSGGMMTGGTHAAGGTNAGGVGGSFAGTTGQGGSTSQGGASGFGGVSGFGGKGGSGGTNTGGGTSQGGASGFGGSGGFAGATGGSGGFGGTTGKSCDDLMNEYAVALEAATWCTPPDSGGFQCNGTTLPSPPCGCPVLVNPEGAYYDDAQAALNRFLERCQWLICIGCVQQPGEPACLPNGGQAGASGVCGWDLGV